MNLPLSYIKGIFVSNMHHWGMGKKTNKESLKRVWKGPVENREKTQGTEYSEAGSEYSWQTDRSFGHWHITARLQPQQQATSSPPGLPKDSLSLLLLLPKRAGAEGTLAAGWEVAAGDVPVSETSPFLGGQVIYQWELRKSLISKCLKYIILAFQWESHK